MQNTGYKLINILDVPVHLGMTSIDVVSYCDRLISNSSASHLIATTSPYFIMSANRDPEFMAILKKAELSVPDGIGVLYANLFLKKVAKHSLGFLYPAKVVLSGIATGIEGFLFRKSLGTTVTGVELTYKLCEMAAAKNYNVFFLGGRTRDSKGNLQAFNNNIQNDLATQAAIKLKSLYPGLRVIGSTSQFSREPLDDAKTIEYISKCMKKSGVEHIDILFVAYNPVDQEKWIARNASKIPAKLSLGIGRTFDYISETMKTPPKVFNDIHMMWLYALMQQPWRLRRVLITFPLFPIKLLSEILKKHTNC